MLNFFQRMMIRWVSKSTLTRYQWYRQHYGGLWVHSYVMGWEQVNKTRFIRDLKLSFKNPALYHYGLDLEWYNTIDIKELTS